MIQCMKEGADISKRSCSNNISSLDRPCSFSHTKVCEIIIQTQNLSFCMEQMFPQLYTSQKTFHERNMYMKIYCKDILDEINSSEHKNGNRKPQLVFLRNMEPCCTLGFGSFNQWSWHICTLFILTIVTCGPRVI